MNCLERVAVTLQSSREVCTLTGQLQMNTSFANKEVSLSFCPLQLHLYGGNRSCRSELLSSLARVRERLQGGRRLL
jgi:hypothetical protein